MYSSEKMNFIGNDDGGISCVHRNTLDSLINSVPLNRNHFSQICCPNRAEWENGHQKRSDDSDEHDLDHSGTEDDDDDYDNVDEYERQSWPHRNYNQRPNSVHRPTRPNNYERPNHNHNFNRPIGNPNSHSPLLKPPFNNHNFNTNGNYGPNGPNINGPNYGNRPNFNRGSNTNPNSNPNYNVPNANYNNYPRPSNTYGGVGADQCSSPSSVLPSPQTGCCGREATNNRNVGKLVFHKY